MAYVLIALIVISGLVYLLLPHKPQVAPVPVDRRVGRQKHQ